MSDVGARSSGREVPPGRPTPGPETAGPETGKPRRRLRLSILPTLCTLGNAVCGFLAICYAADATAQFASPATRAAGSEKVTMAGWIIVLGMVFDMLDGRIARLTRSTSSFGGALDSLADVVTFGMAPALLAKTLCQGVLGWGAERVLFATAAFFAVCATLRLARYNAEHEEPDQAVEGFRGLPTPGAAGVVAGLALSHQRVLEWLDPAPFAREAAAQTIAFVLLLGLGLLMVSRVPFVHFANRFLAGRKPVGRVALVVLVGALMYATSAPDVVVAAVFLAYALSGPVAVVPRLLRGRREEGVPELFD